MTKINHQGYKISAMIDKDSQQVKFTLEDRWGIKSETTEFIDTSFSKDDYNKISQLEAELQQDYLNNYIIQKFATVSEQHIHVEKAQDESTYIRLGDYGLRGGVSQGGLVASVGQVAAGAGLSMTGAGFIPGMALMGAGIRSGIYAANVSEAEANAPEYLREAVIGGVGGAVGTLATAAIASVAGASMVVSAVGGAIGRTVTLFVDVSTDSSKKKLEAADYAKEVAIGAVCGMVTQNTQSALKSSWDFMGSLLFSAPVPRDPKQKSIPEKVVEDVATYSVALEAGIVAGNVLRGQELTKGINEQVPFRTAARMISSSIFAITEPRDGGSGPAGPSPSK